MTAKTPCEIETPISTIVAANIAKIGIVDGLEMLVRSVLNITLRLGTYYKNLFPNSLQMEFYLTQAPPNGILFNTSIMS
jgi:hypothetical protein